MDTGELSITADLAHINLSDEELKMLGDAVSQMVEYFRKMEEVNVDGLEPTTHAFLMKNRGRADLPVPSDLADRLLENAPELEDRFVVIPNVL